MSSITPKSTAFHGTPYVGGTASGRLIASDTELSFWGGVDPVTSEVIDRHHPLSGQILNDTILAIPGGRGSCSGATVIMELLFLGNGPKAILFERREEIITLGVMMAEEYFAKSIPVIVLRPTDFHQVLEWKGEQVHVRDGCVSNSFFKPYLSGETAPAATILESYSQGMDLSPLDHELLNGSKGEAARRAMRVILKLASLLEARELISVRQVHIDACFYTGPASLAIATNLQSLGGKVQVPTTMNATSIDLTRWRMLGIDTTFGETSTVLANAYLAMGAQPTFTCAPYLLDSAPKRNEQIGWGESNAVVYANSVLGARTMKYPDGVDVAIALTGRAPKAGAHLDEHRKASLWVRLSPLPAEIDDSFWPILGHAIGSMCGNSIPVVTGLQSLAPRTDDLKAFGAAFATSSSASMFHLVGITPEACSVEAVSSKVNDIRCADLTWSTLASCWKDFNPLSTPSKVDLISLGNPHFSMPEIRALAQLCRGRIKSHDVEIVVTCGRASYGLASQVGFVEELERFGVQFMTDTCWCFISEPIIPRSARIIMTNSGKYAHYGPGLTGRQFCFGSLQMCAEAACHGTYSGEMPRWLLNATASQ